MGIKRNAVKCLDCDTVIESVHRHNWVQCECGHAFVDGGLEYLRRGFLDETRIEDLTEFDSKSELKRHQASNPPGSGGEDAWTTSEVGL